MKAVAKYAVLLATAIFSFGCGGGNPTPDQPHATSLASPAISAKRPAKHYQVIDLVPIPGANNAQANAISRGHVAGYSVLVDGTPRATLWHDGIAEDLGTGYANAINNSDQVVGYIQPGSLQGDFTPHASLWDHGIVTDLGRLPGFDSTLATGINDSGEVVGIAFSFANPQNESGFTWTAATGMQVIKNAATASGINAHGSIAGMSLNFRATIFSARGTTDLGTLGDFSIAIAINAQGHAAGYSPLTAGGPVHAFFFSGKGKGMQDLGTFGSGDNAVATGVNDSDLVVGYDIVAIAGGAVAHVAHIVTDHSGLWRVGGIAHDLLVGTSQPFVWSATTGMVDLNMLIPQDSGWSLTTASGIDKAGEIVGAGVVSGPTGPVAVHGFMLIPRN